MEINLNDFISKIEAVTHKLIKGVQKGMIGQDGVFYEPPCPSSYVTHANDYFGGRGILVRYMDLLKIKEFSGVDLRENVTRTFNALWSEREIGSNQFKPEFTHIEDRLAYSKQLMVFGQIQDKSLHGILTLTLKDPICQAVGLDYIAANLKFH